MIVARLSPRSNSFSVSTAGLALAVCMSLTSLVSHAGALEQAKRIHDRIAGVPPSGAILTAMTDDINGVGGRSAVDAAYRAMNNPAFYGVTLKNLATPWTNIDFDPFAPLNDYSATVIGMVRDDIDFREILSANTVYLGNTNHASLSGIPAYSNSSNAHYESVEMSNVDLSDPAVLVANTQTAVMGTPAEGTAGVMTTRAAAKAFFIDGTNRAMFRFTLLNHLCNDLEQVKDTSRPSDRIRQDVSRSPGGDSRLFLNSCVGCHSGMDPMAQAFAYYDFVNADGDPEGENGFLQYLPGQVDSKYFNNESTFPHGFVTTDDQWSNYWREGPNAEVLGWDAASPSTGNGASSMGAELARSEAFAQCQVKKVFKQVCLRNPGEADRAAFESIVTNFKSAYQLKQVYADSAVYCMGP